MQGGGARGKGKGEGKGGGKEKQKGQQDPFQGFSPHFKGFPHISAVFKLLDYHFSEGFKQVLSLSGSSSGWYHHLGSQEVDEVSAEMKALV